MSVERSRWRRPAPYLVVVLVLLAVGLPVAGWSLSTSRALSDVEVVGGGPSCSGTVVHRSGDGSAYVREEERLEPLREPVIVAVRGMRCTYSYRVTNHGARPVRLGRATAPFLGPHTGTVIRAETVAGMTPDDGPDRPLDAVVDLARDLGPGRTFSFDIVLAFRPAGCNNGGTLTLADVPAIEVSTWGRTRTRAPAQDVVTYRDGPTPGCRGGS